MIRCTCITDWTGCWRCSQGVLNPSSSPWRASSWKPCSSEECWLPEKASLDPCHKHMGPGSLHRWSSHNCPHPWHGSSILHPQLPTGNRANRESPLVVMEEWARVVWIYGTQTVWEVPTLVGMKWLSNLLLLEQHVLLHQAVPYCPGHDTAHCGNPHTIATECYCVILLKCSYFFFDIGLVYIPFITVQTSSGNRVNKTN